MKVLYRSCYSLEKDIGKAYNYEMSLVQDPEDWVCLMDGDVCFLVPCYGAQINSIIQSHPDTGMFTCLTNRVGELSQCYSGEISENTDMFQHHIIARTLQNDYYSEVKEITKPISGHLMIMQKKTWDEGFKFEENVGILGVDTLMSRKLLNAGKKILLMKGVYVFHLYRLGSINPQVQKLHLL